MPLPTDDHLLELGREVLAAFDAVFGLQPGFRPAHAKGRLATGTFEPTAAAADLSRAPHLARGTTTPVTVRFSNSTGIPRLPDNDPAADPRGIAVRFHLSGRAHTDVIAHSTDGFPTRTGEEFVAFLKSVAATATAPKDVHPSPVEAFLGSHPAALRFVQTPKPTPSSFGRETYFGVTALNFTNAAGATRSGRYRIVPVAGNKFLAPADVAARGADFLFDDLSKRLSVGPVEFRLAAQLAGDGDVVDDATVAWPADRPVADLGLIRLTTLAPDDAAEQQRLIFDPIPRVDGIEPSTDPLLELRAAVYLMSGRRRREAGTVA